MAETYESDETIVNLPGTVEEKPEVDSEKESLQRWWAEFNTADDNFAIHVYRKIPNTAKSEQCFSESVSDTNLNAIADKCRAEFIPIGERDSEFILKFQDKKTGKFKGQKNICITRKNSDLNKPGSNQENQLASVMHDLMRQQQAANETMLTRIIESQNKDKSNGFTDFLQSGAGLALITAVSPALVKMLMPKEAPNASAGIKEAMETFMLFKTMMEPAEQEEKEGSMFSIVSDAIKTMGPGLADTAASIAKRQENLPAPPKPDLDQAIREENANRAANAPAGEAPQDVLQRVIAMMLGGARRQSDVAAYSLVVLDQIPDEMIGDFEILLNDANILTAINNLNPATVEFNEWFAAIIPQLKEDIAATFEETAEDLTPASNEVIIPDNDDSDLTVDNGADSINNDGDTIRSYGDAGDPSPDEPIR